MNDLKQVKILNMDDKVMHYIWLECHIAEVGDNALWINGTVIYKHSLKDTTYVL